MEITKRAPKRQRKERGCISRTFRHVTISAAIYDREHKREIRKTYDFLAASAELTTEKLMKMIRKDVSENMRNAIFLDFDVVTSEEVRYYMTESDFIRHAIKAE